MNDTKIAELINRITGANKGLAKKVTKKDIAKIRHDLSKIKNK